jgi:hypothetical protein
MNWTEGYFLQEIDLPAEILQLAQSRDFSQLDQLMTTYIEESLKPLFKRYKDFNHIEHIISYRCGEDPYEEDGIWHDDGSRVLAFSLSLNVFGEIQGGSLGFRKKGQSATELGPYPPGTLLIFQTGMDGFEHRTARVIKGERLVCAGWCS